MLDSFFDDAMLTTVGIIALVLICTVGSFVLTGGIWYIVARSNKKKKAALMETGQQGEATILSLEDTGMLINNNPRVRIGMEVRIPGYPPYRIQKTMTVPMIRLSQVQVGNVVQVIADPTEPQNPDKIGLLLR